MSESGETGEGDNKKNTFSTFPLLGGMSWAIQAEWARTALCKLPSCFILATEAKNDLLGEGSLDEER